MGKGGRGFGQYGNHPGELVGAAVVGFYRQGDVKRACVGVVVGYTRVGREKDSSEYFHRQNPRSSGLHNRLAALLKSVKLTASPLQVGVLKPKLALGKGAITMGLEMVLLQPAVSVMVKRNGIRSGRSVGMGGCLYIRTAAVAKSPVPAGNGGYRHARRGKQCRVIGAGTLCGEINCRNWFYRDRFCNGIRTVVAGKGDQFYGIGSGSGKDMGWVLKDAGIADARSRIAKIPVPAGQASGCRSRKLNR